MPISYFVGACTAIAAGASTIALGYSSYTSYKTNKQFASILKSPYPTARLTAFFKENPSFNINKVPLHHIGVDETPLTYAIRTKAEYKTEDFVGLLLSHGADYNIKTPITHTTPLMTAAKWGTVDDVSHIFYHGNRLTSFSPCLTRFMSATSSSVLTRIDVECTDKPNGMNAIMYALQRSGDDMGWNMVSNVDSINPDIVDKDGHSVGWYAKEFIGKRTGAICNGSDYVVGDIVDLVSKKTKVRKP